MKLKHLPQTIAVTLILSGCSFAPKYEQPKVALAKNWIGIALQEQQGQIAATDLGWRQYFLDPRLQKLIETALANNHDFKKAALNIELMQAKYGITKASELPTVGLNGGYTRSRTSSSYIREQYNVGLGISNFELDFFGRIKNQSKAALNDYLATKEARDTAQLSLINSVAKTYYQWRISRALKTLASKTLASREETYKLTKLRFQEGIASGTDLTTAQTTIASALSAYQQQSLAMQQTENTLAMLVGQPLDSLNLPKGLHLTQQFPKKELFVGLPSQVLLKRPDIRQAEYTLKGANANIGAARAAMFPTISLTGSLGYASTALSNLVEGGSRLWSFSPSITLPIFDMGRRKANVKISEISQKMALETYRQTMQAAFYDINDALVAKKVLAKQYAAEQKGQAATAETLRLVRLQVQEGLANALNLLDAERADFITRQGLLLTLLQLTNNHVDLYTALGGGLTEVNVIPAKTL